MGEIVEIFTINDISNIIEKKQCGLNLIYYIKSEDVKIGGQIYKMIVKMDRECNPESIFYTKTLDIKEIEKNIVLLKQHKSRSKKGYEYSAEIKTQNQTRSLLEGHIKNICMKLV